ncbi:MAG: hypothetical protein FWH01_16250 [Oscillospiraceae bacterium]|nr:hypothetical protein [Oscillospiraceae bacterium]
MNMTNRQLFNALLDGEPTGPAGQILWAARLDVWYRQLKATDTLPEKYAGMSLNQIHKAMEIGFPQKSDEKNRLFKPEINGVRQYEERDGDNLHRYFETPFGTVYDTYHVDAYRAANRLSFATTHIGYRLKGEKDFKPVRYILENTTYVPYYDDYYAYEEEIGDDGLAFIFTANDPFSTVMRDYAGIEQFCYLLADYPELVDGLIGALAEKMEAELQPIMFGCPARVAHHGGHYDSMVTSPPLFEKYILPYLQRFSGELHGMGKFLALHTDADSRLIMGLLEGAGMDMAECFCTAPMVGVTLEQALDCWGDRVIIWGGVPSIILCPDSCSYGDFVDYMSAAIALIRSRKCRVILGVSDNVMPETDITRLEKITDMVNEANRLRYD